MSVGAEGVSLRKRLDLISSAATAGLHHLTRHIINVSILRHRIVSMTCLNYDEALSKVILASWWRKEEDNRTRGTSFAASPPVVAPDYFFEAPLTFHYYESRPIHLHTISDRQSSDLAKSATKKDSACNCSQIPAPIPPHCYLCDRPHWTTV